ncbi:MAG: hypothetical protein M3308_01370 [Actinomycetota bacterium]|nr:hypothetical protein [Actinomycetota bacterium]
MSSPDRTLPCGWPVSSLVDLATGDDTPGTPAACPDMEHPHSCPYCQQELAILRRRWAAVRSAAHRPVRIPPDLIDRTLSAVRAVRGGLVPRHVEAPQRGGMVRIAESAVMLLVRQMAREVIDGLAGVRFRGLSGDVDGLQVRVAVRYGMTLAEVTTRVRRDIGSALENVLGAATPPLDVLVDDVLAPSHHD